MVRELTVGFDPVAGLYFRVVEGKRRGKGRQRRGFYCRARWVGSRGLYTDLHLYRRRDGGTCGHDAVTNQWVWARTVRVGWHR
jgi:hypothetical protein